jgi:glycosyltransferase involved in cell wall biosynthesis
LPSPAGNESPLRIVYLTAGAAGMICGSCLHDNTLARALLELGHDVQLVPLYTPIETDEPDVSRPEVFFGGINLYLQQKFPLLRWLPKWLDHWLDRPWLIRWASGRSVKIDPIEVADLTVSLLRGMEGHQRKEVERLAEWLSGDLHPDVLVFSNMLTAGCVPEIKRRMRVPVVVTLQGDDIFLRALPQPQQEQALAAIRGLARSVDAFFVHSRFYADAMAAYLGLPREKMRIVPLGIDTRLFEGPWRDDMCAAGDGRASAAVGQASQLTPAGQDAAARGAAAEPACAAGSGQGVPVGQAASAVGVAGRVPTVGYLARLAPEKGLHVLAEAFVLLRRMPGTESARLRVAGWLGAAHRPYAEQVFARLRAAGLDGSFEYVGQVDLPGKVAFLKSLDVLAVPTTYQEPKGLFVLEAMAAGVPVVLPAHGAFPEVVAETSGGLLHRPEDPADLAARLHELLTDSERRRRLAEAGWQAVRSRRSALVMARATADALREVLRGGVAPRSEVGPPGEGVPAELHRGQGRSGEAASNDGAPRDKPASGASGGAGDWIAAPSPASPRAGDAPSGEG